MKIKYLTPLILLLPPIAFLLAHIYGAISNPDITFTGFLTGEAPYYMANARQYLDFGFDSLFYANPYSSDLNSTRHYFQFQTYILAIMLKITALPPGIVWNIFGLFFSYLFIKEAQCFLQREVIKSTNVNYLTYLLLMILFFYGGGLHAISGALFTLIKSGLNFGEIARNTEFFEIAEGWWMHSIGRNFLLPNYIFYFFLVFKIINNISQKKYNKSFIWQFILIFSHPFVGVQTIFSICIWKTFEYLYLRSKLISGRKLLINYGLLVLHLAYYMVILNLDPEHKQQEQQWKTSYENLYQNWAMMAKNFIPSYILAIGLFLLNISPSKNFAPFFKSPTHRFLAILGVCNFVIANHEFAISPLQPIHFTHGMVWFPFAILGLGFIVKLINEKKLSTFVLLVFTLFFTLDNSTWYAKRIQQESNGKNQQLRPLTKEGKEIIEFINDNYNSTEFLLVSMNKNISYMSSVYTKTRQWLGHTNITPNAFQKGLELKDLTMNKHFSKSWEVDSTLFLTDKSFDIPSSIDIKILKKTNLFTLWKRY